MTRDEAISKLHMTPTTSRGFTDADGLVAALSALGILSFDQPKTTMDKFDDLVVCYGLTRAEAYGLRNMLAKARLKIVEE